MQPSLQVNPASRSRFRARLLVWYGRHKRNLPWRRSQNPYHIWISEIMLQQTRVEAVQDHYERFLRRFPNVKRLAGASLDEVLAAWSGLGYYRRARHVHEAAKEIVSRMGGRLPRSAAAWAALPGVGRYTAAAIASIAFGEPCAAVDGNVERVLRRVLDDDKLAGRRLWDVAASVMAERRPGEFNQAMMELGATLCTPRNPRCDACPVYALCATRGAHAPAARPARGSQVVCYGLHLRQGKILLVRRPERESVMPGMWELPAGEHAAAAVFVLRHSIMNTDYQVRVVGANGRRPEGAHWLALERVAEIPLTGLARKILCRAGLLHNRK